MSEVPLYVVGGTILWTENARGGEAPGQRRAGGRGDATRLGVGAPRTVKIFCTEQDQLFRFGTSHQLGFLTRIYFALTN